MGRRTLALDVRHLNEHVGSEVVIGTDELLTEPAAQALRRLLVERGVIVIKRIGLNESEQRSLSEMMGALRQEGDRGVLKITLDRQGMPREEGEALLQELLGWATQPAFVYRHQWEPGDLLMWDNTGVLHRVQPYPLDSGRLMRRTTLMGEEAFA